MTDVRTLGCRQYMAEDELYPKERALRAELDAIECTLGDLDVIVHKLVREAGRIPVEDKAFEIVRRVSQAFARIDTAKLEAMARDAQALRDRVDAIEEEIAKEQLTQAGALA